jgi:integrase
MTIKKVASGWQVDIQPGGRGGRRVRKTFAAKSEALAWERHIQAKVQEMPDWMPAKKDGRRLLDLVEIWASRHGVTLRDGENRAVRLRAICKAMGNPLADKFSAQDFAEYRSRRLSDGITQTNMNRELQYLKAMFNTLNALDVWQRDNPLTKLKAIKVAERELSFLTLDQVERLLGALPQSRNPHVTLISKICLATGARWGEAEEITIQQVRNGTIQYSRTKSGKVRAVPIEAGLELEIVGHHEQHGIGNRVFQSAWSAFREGVERAEIELPMGQMTHVLRHTFASHFMMAGGNILALQRILGHQSLVMTMRYAHLAPDHLKEARDFNPLALCKSRNY